MSAEYTEVCSTCGRPILPITARQTGGICRRCERDEAKAINQANWEAYCQNGRTPISSAEFAELSRDPNLERACHVIFEKAHWKWTFHGLEQLTLGERTVIAVETFFGECCNGGLTQYLLNNSGALARELPDALMLVGLSAYAPLVIDLLNQLPAPFPHDLDERLASVIELKKASDACPVERADKRFFELLDEDDFRRQLHHYIFSHPSEFVALHV